MSWHISNVMEKEFESSRYLRALGAEFSAGNFSAGEQCAQWKLFPSAPDDLCSGKMKDTCHRSPYGTMFVPSTDALGAELLTWFLAGFPVRTSVPLAKEPESKPELDQDSGKSSSESLEMCDLASHSSRTHRALWTKDWTLYSMTLPSAGTMRNGQFWARETVAPVMSENASGFSQPTPVCYDAPGSSETRGMPGLVDWAHQRYSREAKKSWLVPELLEQVMGWPIGWTGLAPLEMDRFQQWSQRHVQFWLDASYSNAHRERPSVVNRPNECEVDDGTQPDLFA